MIYGIGLDLCREERMARSLSSPAFCRRVFGPQEQQLLAGLPPHRQAQTGAANFAAKEAFLKATGHGLGAFPLAEIQCLRLESGAPVLVCRGTVEAYLKEHHLKAFVSLTHEGGMAGAMVVLEQINPAEG